jgi:hypothetical protein
MSGESAMTIVFRVSSAEDWQVGGLERGPLSLVITTEEPLEKISSGSGLENRD